MKVFGIENARHYLVEEALGVVRLTIVSPLKGFPHSVSLCEKSGQIPRVANQGEYPNEQKTTTKIYR